MQCEPLRIRNRTSGLQPRLLRVSSKTLKPSTALTSSIGTLSYGPVNLSALRNLLIVSKYQLTIRPLFNALIDHYGKNPHRLRLSQWAKRLQPFDFEIVNYLTQYSTVDAPLNFQNDKVFVIKMVQSFNKAISKN